MSQHKIYCDLNSEIPNTIHKCTCGVNDIKPCSVCGYPTPLGLPMTPESGGSRTCMYLGEDWHIEAAKDLNKQHPTLYLQRQRKGSDSFYKQEAKRDPIKFRFDILDQEFLQALAAIAHFGAEKYGEFNWHKSRLTGDKSPVNHIYKHLLSYGASLEYDHPELGKERKMHLAAIAFNAMMEFFYESHPTYDKIDQAYKEVMQGTDTEKRF